MKNMLINISKTDWNSLVKYIDRASAILKEKSTKPSEYNTARMLKNTKDNIIRKNKQHERKSENTK